jgi:hypothetical protein
LAVAEQAKEEGLMGIDENTDLGDAIDQVRWRPQYYPYHYVKNLGENK